MERKPIFHFTSMRKKKLATFISSTSCHCFTSRVSKNTSGPILTRRRDWARTNFRDAQSLCARLQLIDLPHDFFPWKLFFFLWLAAITFDEGLFRRFGNIIAGLIDVKVLLLHKFNHMSYHRTIWSILKEIIQKYQFNFCSLIVSWNWHWKRSGVIIKKS